MRTIHELLPTPPRTEYVSNETHRRLKSQLTRAERSGQPIKVLAAVEAALEGWRGKAWPDDWSRWSRALQDAYQARVRIEAWGEGPDDPISDEERARWASAALRIIR